ncbi:MAG: ATP-binding domain-containing protein, partial [Bacteroidaceae bacterium]|nr:ATP-binding domain-containing protein [Bacteroidaceae bacterium]
NPNDEEAFKRVINYPARGIGQTTVSKILASATSNEVSLWTVIGAPERYGLEVNKGTLGKIAQFKQLIDGFIEQARTLPANQLGTMIVKQSGITADIYQDSTPENLSRQENVEELINGMQDFCDMRMEEGNENILLSDYISEVSLMSDVDSDKGGDEHKVTLMTIHSAKGLEFGTVFVVGLEEGLFPSDMVSGNPREMEEERRLFYVAITRAKTHCYLSYAQCRFRYGQMEFSAPSRFLKDIDPKYLDRQQSMFSTRRSIDDDVQLPWARKSGQSAQPRPFRPTIPSPSVRPMSVGGSQGTSPSSMRRVASSSETNKTFSPVSQTIGTSNGLPAHHTGGALKEGNYILHNRFGRGQVLRIEGTGDSTKATVQFENVGTKQLLLKFAKFEVIG